MLGQQPFAVMKESAPVVAAVPIAAEQWPVSDLVPGHDGSSVAVADLLTPAPQTQVSAVATPVGQLVFAPDDLVPIVG